jgi:hypothetical protein
MKMQSQTFLSSTADKVEWQILRSFHFNPEDKAIDTHYV